MKKSNLVALIVYFACVAYIIGTGIPEAMFGKTSVTDVAGAVMVVFFAALLPAGLVLFACNKAIWKSGERTATPRARNTQIIAGFAAVALVAGLFVGGGRVYSVKSTEWAEQDRWNALTPEQKQAELDRREQDRRIAAAQAEAKEKLEADKAAEKVASDKRFAAAVLFLKAIKSASRDPSSFDPESVFVNENATVICVEYRGKNGFGGYSREFAVYSNGKANQSADVWNKQCRKEMYDVTYARQAL